MFILSSFRFEFLNMTAKICGVIDYFFIGMKVGGKLVALKGLEARLKEIHAYLELVVEGRLPLNHEILYHLQVSWN